MKSEPVRYSASTASFGLRSTNSLSGKRRGLTIAFDQLAARLPIMKVYRKAHPCSESNPKLHRSDIHHVTPPDGLPSRSRATPRESGLKRPYGRRTNRFRIALDDRRASGMVPFRIHVRSHREQRLARCVFHFVRPGLLYAVDDVLRHRDVIELLGHLVALVVGPGGDIEGPGRQRHNPR